MNQTPDNLAPMAIENAPPVAPALTPQEKSVLYGTVREKVMNSSTMVGGGIGAVGGAIIGGIWSFVTKGGDKNHWGRKTLGTAVVAAAIGAIASRFTWGKNTAEQTVNHLEQQISVLPPEQQVIAHDQIAMQLGLNPPVRPQTSVMAETIQHQGPQAAPAQAIG